jgi:poly(3-hydroxyalkanoate) synthetase
LKARGESPVASLTLLTTLLDFSDTGEIGLFIDENGVGTREATIGKGGLLPARDLQNTFSFLRANDLVWNYVTGNYLKGRSRRLSTCCTGIPTRPICRGRSPPGTCATCISKTICACRAS